MHICILFLAIMAWTTESTACRTQFQHNEGNRRVRDQYIISLRAESNTPAAIVNTVSDIRVLQEDRLGSMAWVLVEGPLEAMQRLNQRPEILSVDVNRVYGLSGTRPPQREIKNGKF